MDRGGKTYGMSFRRGEPGTFTDRRAAHSPDGDLHRRTRASELPVVGRAKRGVTGSRVRFWPDRADLPQGRRARLRRSVGRARQTSFLIPGLRLVIRDERGLPGTPGADGPVEEVFQHDGGITEFVEFLAPDPPITEVWRLQGSGTFTETVPGPRRRRPHDADRAERECVVDVALRWGPGYDAKVQSRSSTSSPRPRAAPT